MRLRPRCDTSQRLVRYQFEVTPSPTGYSEGLDAENNTFRLLWFHELCEQLDITITTEVETLRTNPFEGLLLEGNDHLPLQMNERALCPFLNTPKTVEDETLTELVNELLDQTQGRTLDFLAQLTGRLHQSIEKVTRTEPGIQSLHETLCTGKGACRDLAVVFMAASRGVGIPARFVTGYQQGDPAKSYGDLHAWAEVFLPGFGWRGYDPTHGLAVADRHVAVTAAAEPEHTAPVIGTFRGTNAHSTLEHTITIRTT